MDAATLNLRHLRAYQAVQHSGSITAASDQAHMSQPTITHAIAKLERRVGVDLFHRHRTGMTPTKAGALFGPRVDHAITGLKEGCRRASIKARQGRETRFYPRITSTQLRALNAVAQHGNFSIAARALGIAQPTLYRAARDIESLAGFCLYEKTSSGIALTPAAAILNRSAKIAFAELNQALQEARQTAGEGVATLLIGSLPLARVSLLPNAIARLTADHPKTAIQVIDGPYANLLHDLRDGDIDMIIGALRDPLPCDDVVQDTLFQDRLGIYCGPLHPLATASTITADQLRNYGWVVPRQGTPTRDIFDAFARDVGISTQTALVEASSMILVRGLLGASDRLTMLSTHQVAEEVHRGDFHRLPVPFRDDGRPIGLAFRTTWKPTQTQKQFIDLLRQEAMARADPDL